ncbi:U2 snRNP component IST3 [Cercophora scortea]|uniref:U2 snRNP component IST3 n=1 Tax=Cercophora scortea TaxID=314031 RepID=A0AAE0MM85_9PEZI|nr:U2 snRNP component IST3 [Cercophora scortea]
MNQIRAIQALNKREIENGVPPSASWHVDYRDTAYVYFGGLPFDLTEGDVITIFSQFGEPVFLKLARDKETGKSKGFGWLKYEDQRSTDLAVDNLGGAEIAGRLVRVDHARYKHRDDEDPEEGRVGWEDMLRREGGAAQGDSEDGMDVDEEDVEKKQRPLLKEEVELQALIQDHDDDDPMKQFLIDEKKKEVDEGLRREKKRAERHSHSHGNSHRHRDKDCAHRSSHRSRRDGDDHHHKRERVRDKDDRDSGRDSKPRAPDEAPVEKRRRGDRDDDDDRRERRRRDSRDRESRSHRDRPRERIEDSRRVDRGDEDKGREDHTRHRRRGSTDTGRRDERSHRDRRRSRSRSPASRRD